MVYSGKTFLTTEVSRAEVVDHKVRIRIYKEFHSVCPLVGIGTLPTPLLPASVPLTPRTGGGGGAHSPAGEGLGESPIPTTGEKA